MKAKSSIISLTLGLFLMGIINTSCSKKEGCTNPDAINFDVEAEENDGSCVFEEETALVVPSTYTFVGGEDVSTVSFSGQMQRLEMLTEMVTLMKTGNTQGTVLDGTTLRNMYANSGYTWIDAPNLGLNNTTKQLRSKTAKNDVGVQAMFEDFIDSIVVNSTFNVVGSYGQAGIWTNGTKNYLQSATGVEYIQLIEKGLMGAVFLNQMLCNYIGNIASDDNTAIVDGKTYTDMQHHWDEAYGYFTSATDYPINGTDRFWGRYANLREPVLGSATKIAEAFRTGRAAIDANDFAIRDAQATIIRDEMLKVVAGTAIHYLNEAKANIADDALKNHVLSEAWAFIDDLRFGEFNSGTGLTTTEIDTALDFFNDFSTVTITDLNTAVDFIASRTGLEGVKNSL